MPEWAYVFMLIFLFGIGVELGYIHDTLRAILEELQKSK